MTDLRRHKARYWMRRLAGAHSVLASPASGTFERSRARCRANQAARALGALQPIPPMKRELEVDRLAEKRRGRLVA